MRLERITLKNFRNFAERTYHLKEMSVIVARNGSGKTNLLEAIQMLSTGESVRASRIEEMISWDREIASVSGILEEQGERRELSIVLTRGMYMGKKTPKRRLLVDGVARSRSTFAGQLVVCVFRPEDMRLLEGSPSRRRSYLDETIGVANTEYQRALTIYEKTLTRRNRILDEIREGRARRAELAYWDQSLIKNGNIISEYRIKYLDYLNDRVEVAFGKYQVEYAPSAISSERLTAYYEAEVAVGHTLVGPHKDDFVVKDENGVDLSVYGSRGEQRLGVLFLKMGGMEYIDQARGVKAMLLLDDIMSELDQEHQDQVMAMTKERQVVLTSAEEKVGSLAREAKISLLNLN